MFQTFVERPVFNFLEFIYALIPGHDLGLAIIIFTVIIRMALYPVVRRQLHHQKAMRALRPQIKKVKKAAGGDRQKQARLQSELFKEHGIRPFATIGITIIQLPIFLALYFSIRNLITDPNTLLKHSYEWVRELPWIQHLATDINQFEHSFYGIIDLSRNGFGSEGIYIQGVVLALIAAFVQYHQTKQLLPDAQNASKLSDILKQSTEGKQADSAELGDAVSRGMLYIIPPAAFIGVMLFPMALGLYLLTSSAVGYLQQRYVLNKDIDEMTEIADEKPTPKDGIKVTMGPVQKPKTQKKKPSTKKRRK